MRCHARAALAVPLQQRGMRVPQLWRAWCLRTRRAWGRGVLEDPGAASLPEAVCRVRRAALAAMAAYRPQRCELPIALLRSELAMSRDCDPRLIWRRLVSQLLVHDVAGDHLTILRPPHLQGLAEQLSRAVESAVTGAAAELGRVAPRTSATDVAADGPGRVAIG
jgi:hypothetical protein